MGKMSRDKGQRAERQVIQILQPVVDAVYNKALLMPPKLRRNLQQTAIGGYDVVGLEWMALEVKHHQVLSLGAWWTQTLRQAQSHQQPVLFFKTNNVPWRVRTEARVAAGDKFLPLPVDMDVASFVAYLVEELTARLPDDDDEKVVNFMLARP